MSCGSWGSWFRDAGVKPLCTTIFRCAFFLGDVFFPYDITRWQWKLCKSVAVEVRCPLRNECSGIWLATISYRSLATHRT